MPLEWPRSTPRLTPGRVVRTEGIARGIRRGNDLPQRLFVSDGGATPSKSSGRYMVGDLRAVCLCADAVGTISSVGKACLRLVGVVEFDVYEAADDRQSAVLHD